MDTAALRAQRWRLIRAESERLLGRPKLIQRLRDLLKAKAPSAQTDWMNDCVPDAIDAGYPQDQAIAICIHIWEGDNPPEAGDSTDIADR